MVRTAAAAAASASGVLFAVWLILQPSSVSGAVYTVMPLVQWHLPSCSDVRNHDNCTIVQRPLQVPKFQCIVANGTETIYLDGRNDTHAYAYDNESAVVAWNDSICTIQEPYCRTSMDVCRQFPYGTTPCHNGTLDPEVLRLRPTATSLCWIDGLLVDLEEFGAEEVSSYGFGNCHPTEVQNNTQLSLVEMAALLKQPAVPGDVALQYVCRKRPAEDGINNDGIFAVRYFDWKDGSLYGTATDDGEELPGWTCIAEEVWYNPFNFTWENSGALNDDGTLSDCNVTKESETGDTILTLNSGVMGTVTIATMTAIATFYIMLV
jgi:hypothetical protein